MVEDHAARQSLTDSWAFSFLFFLSPLAYKKKAELVGGLLRDLLLLARKVVEETHPNVKQLGAEADWVYVKGPHTANPTGPHIFLL